MSKLKLFILIVVIAIILLLAGAFTAISIASYKPTLAFYNVSEKVQKAILTEIASMPVGRKGKNIEYNVLVLDSTVPLSSQKQAFKAKMIFATMDSDVQEVARGGKVIPQDISLSNGMPSSLKAQLITKNNKICAVPLLYDFYEIDIFRPAFTESKIGKIADWKDLTAFTQKTTKDDFSPVVFSGGDNADALNVFGCLIELFGGRAALEECEEKLYQAYKSGSGQTINETLDSLEKKNEGVSQAVKALKDLYAGKSLNTSVFSFKPNDTLFFLNNNLCNTAFLKLSDHRNISYSIINKYTSIYVPGQNGNDDRSFLAPEICALVLDKNKAYSSTVNLLTNSRQSSLSIATGLSPVQASCAVPDKQADDVRFWLAASNGPVMPLSGALPSEEMRKAAADWISAKARFKEL